jgi:cytoskeleton protein RodZ
MDKQHFGTFLRDERERQRVSLADIAEKTKLSISSLKLLEAGRLGDLPSEVFVRGFVKAYAQALLIPSSEPLGLLDLAFSERRRAADSPLTVTVSKAWQPPFPTPQESVAEEEAQPSRHGIGLAVFVIIVLLIATITLSLFVRQQPQSGEGLSQVSSFDRALDTRKA